MKILPTLRLFWGTLTSGGRWDLRYGGSMRILGKSFLPELFLPGGRFFVSIGFGLHRRQNCWKSEYRAMAWLESLPTICPSGLFSNSQTLAHPNERSDMGKRVGLPAAAKATQSGECNEDGRSIGSAVAENQTGRCAPACRAILIFAVTGRPVASLAFRRTTRRG